MKRTIISGAVLALAIAGVGTASAAKPSESGNNGGYKVTGGGQIIAEGTQGAGDTVGFNAHRLEEGGTAARGQFQFVPRGQSGESAGDEKFHGTVTCLISGAEAQAQEMGAMEDSDAIMPGSARFGGFLRGGTQAFTVDVTDNGQGANADGGDMILVRLTDQPCADNPESEDGTAEDLLLLGRGNVKIHNNVDEPAALVARLAK